MWIQWYFWIIASIIVLGASILICCVKRNPFTGNKVSNPLRVAFAGFFASAWLLFLPICYTQHGQKSGGILITFLAAIHSAVKLFVVDSDFSMVNDVVGVLNNNIKNAYEVLGAILITACPMLTFGFVLSFLKSAMSFQKYILHYFQDAYIFSEANEKSLALAESLRAANKKCMLIFNDMFETEEESSYELRGRIQEIGGICFRKDIVSIDYRFHRKKSQLYFFVIGGNESENIAQALKLIEKYKDFSNVRIDVFAKGKQAEILLNSKDKGKIQMIRRINDVQSLITRILYETGEQIFRHCETRNGKKVISAIVIGMGNHGLEMAKTLTWFCQMIGYEFEMNVFDKDPDAQGIFAMNCPDLLDEKYNGIEIDGEPSYKIKVHSGVDVNTIQFRKRLEAIPNPSYVFIALGSDAQNVKTATDIRAMYALNEFQPRIQAVLYNSSEKEALYQSKYNDSKRTQAYEIEYVGDLQSSYSREVILISELEKKALERHLGYGGTEESFWGYEYNYRSSVASAIHQKMKLLLEIPYADIEPQKRPEQEREVLRKLEHCRWSAYVRSEGYTWGAERNDLAKKHPCLIPYEELSDEDKAKDDV